MDNNFLKIEFTGSTSKSTSLLKDGIAKIKELNKARIIKKNCKSLSPEENMLIKNDYLNNGLTITRLQTENYIVNSLVKKGVIIQYGITGSKYVLSDVAVKYFYQNK